MLGINPVIVIVDNQIIPTWPKGANNTNYTTWEGGGERREREIIKIKGI